MANTVHGPYAPTAWVNGSTPANQTNMNHLEGQNGVALASINPKLITAAFILSGSVASKDAATATQLDLTSGTAYLFMTDGTLAQIDIVASTPGQFSTSGHPTATMFLDLNPDGSWSFATTHSAITNHITICSLTTDGASNISGVTDARPLAIPLLGGKDLNAGAVSLPAPLAVNLNQNGALVGIVNSSAGVTFGQPGAIGNDPDTAALFTAASSGQINAPNTGLPTGNSAFALEGWFKTSTTGINGMLLSMGPNLTKQAGLLYVTTANKLAGDLDNSPITSTATYTDGAWHHAVFTWDGANAILYADGAQVASSTTLGANALVQSFPLGIGYQGGFGANFFNGSLAKLAVYGTAISATRVAAHYAARTGGGYDAAVMADSPLRYYKLADAVGSLYAGDTIPAATSTLLDRGGNLALPGGVQTIAGQATAGSFGVPVIMAQAINVHVTTTALTSIVSFTAPANGLYRVSAYLYANSTSITTNKLYVSYTEANSGLAAFGYFSDATPTITESAGTAMPMFNGVYGVGTNTSHTTPPLTVYAHSGTTVSVQYQTAASVVSDFVSAFIERMS